MERFPILEHRAVIVAEEITARFFNVIRLLNRAVPIIAIQRFRLLPLIGARFARSRDQELFLVGALGLGFAIAALTQAVGLSTPLSAFLAGIIAGGLKYAQDTFAGFLPLRNVCVAFFFVTVGAMIDFSNVAANVWLLCVILAFIVLGKTVVWTTLLRVFHYPIWSAVLAGVGLAQIGEFSYVLLRTARDSGIVENEMYNTAMAALLLTVLCNVLLTGIVRSRGLVESRAASS